MFYVMLVVFVVLTILLAVYLFGSVSREVTRRGESEAYEPTALPNAPAGWPVIARADNGLTATMMKNFLESHEVEAVIEESHFARLYYAGGEPSSVATPLYVRPGDEDEARRLLQSTDFGRFLV